MSAAGAVLLTRPAPESRAVAEELAPIPCLTWEVTRIAHRAAALPEAEAVVFTSRHGVAGFLGAGGRAEGPAWCVGPATAAAARAAGFVPVHEAGGTAADLLADLRAGAPRRMLYARGADISADLRAALEGDGLEVREAVVYAAEETGPPPPDIARALEAGGVWIVTAWSARGARIVARHVGAGQVRAAVAISDAAAGPLEEAGFAPVARATVPDRDGMCAAIREQFAALQQSAGKSVV